MKLNEKIIEVIEIYGFSYSAVVEQDDEYYIELYQDTPAGEDWHVTIWFDGNDNSFINSFREYVESFDVDEEVEILIGSRGKNGVPNSISVLVKDAEWKKEKLRFLLKYLEDIDLENNVLTVFVLDHVDNEVKPILYMIPSNKQLEVEKLAMLLKVNEYNEEFENLLTKNHIKYEWMGSIHSAKYRQEDWIDDKIARVIVG